MSPSIHTEIDKIRRELQSLRDLGTITTTQFERAIRYVSAHEADVGVLLDSPSSISDVVDIIVEMSLMCSNGKCE